VIRCGSAERGKGRIRRDWKEARAGGEESKSEGSGDRSEKDGDKKEDKIVRFLNIRRK